MKSIGILYLIHFHKPYHHAQHYIGWTQNGLRERIECHRSGQGARLLQVVNDAGIKWEVVRTWKAERGRERQLKARGHAPHYCPICMNGKPYTPKWAQNKGNKEEAQKCIEG